MKFSKYEGLGNHFIVVESNADREWLIEHAEAVCDPHFGIGADGILLVSRQTPSMEVINEDGSISEMCGNGLRCVAAYLLNSSDDSSITISTGAGMLSCHRHSNGNIEVNMGMPRLSNTPALLNEPLKSIANSQHTFTQVDMPNPHCISFVDHSAKKLAAQLGPTIEQAVEFPNRSNVEFATLLDDGTIELHVWERGVGLTMACGTGACATVYAACVLGRISFGEDVRVALPGGDLTVNIATPTGPAIKTGPARLIFEGEFHKNSFK